MTHAGRPTAAPRTNPTRSCSRCGVTIGAWKRKDRKPSALSGICADCRATDPVYLDMVLGREVRRPEPRYDPETAAWVGDTPDYDVIVGERFDRAAIVRERPATTVRRAILGREVEEAEAAERLAAHHRHVLHVSMDGTTAARDVRR